MFRKKGFTLVEMLFVLIITATIVAFAVPSYRRARERSNYERNLGVLVSIGGAIQSLKRDLVSQYGFQDGQVDGLPGGGYEIPNSPTWVSSMPPNSTAGDFVRKGVAEGEESEYFVRALYEFGYLEPFSQNEYGFYTGGAGTSTNCSSCAGSVVCMCLSSDAASDYYGAKLHENGVVERLTYNP